MMQILPIAMWLLAVAFAVLQFFTQLTMGHMAYQLMDSFKVDSLSLSYLSSSFFYTFLLMQIPAGMLLDRYGRRLILSIAIIFFAIGCILFSMSQTFHWAIVTRLVMGVGSAFGFLSMVSVAAIWFRPELFAFLVGLGEMIVMSVVAIGQIFLADWLVNLGWRSIFISIATIALILFFLIALFLRDPKTKCIQANMPNKLSTLCHTLSNKQAWLIGLSSGLLLTILTVYCALWGVPFLVNVHHFSYQQAGIAMAVTALGLGIGAALTSYYAGRFSVLKPVLYGFLVLSIMIYFIIFWAPNQKPTLIYSLNFLLGFCAGSYVLFFEMTRKISSQNNINTLVGFINMITMSGSIFIQPLIGYILDSFNQGVIMNGLPSNSVHAYQVAMSSLLFCPLAAIVLVAMIKEQKPHSLRHPHIIRLG